MATRGCDPQYGGGCADDKLSPNTRICHCTVCHETFSVIEHFDAHRVASRGDKPNKCRPPGEIKVLKGVRAGEFLLKKNARGIWIGNRPNPMHGGEEEDE